LSASYNLGVLTITLSQVDGDTMPSADHRST
jgi:hypothetical protein